MHLSTIASEPATPIPATQFSTTIPRTALADVAVIGLGYVGLPLSLQFARSGVNVLGLDIDPEKVNALTKAGVISSTSAASQWPKR